MSDMIVIQPTDLSENDFSNVDGLLTVKLNPAPDNKLKMQLDGLYAHDGNNLPNRSVYSLGPTPVAHKGVVFQIEIGEVWFGNITFPPGFMLESCVSLYPFLDSLIYLNDSGVINVTDIGIGVHDSWFFVHHVYGSNDGAMMDVCRAHIVEHGSALVLIIDDIYSGPFLQPVLK